MKKEYLKVCPRCEHTFITTQFPEVYCSENCTRLDEFNEIHRNFENPAVRKALKKTCPICKKLFKTFAWDQKYCSGKCVRRAWQRHSSWLKIRFEVLNRDNFTCQYCGRNPTNDGIKLHVDHITPKRKGGTDDFDNLVTACNECNLSKITDSLNNEVGFKERLELSKYAQRYPKFAGK